MRDRVSANGIGLVSQSHGETAVAERGVGRRGSEFWVSHNGAANHATNDLHNVYDWVEIPPSRETVLIGDGTAM